jgi:hypothetical protein
LVPFKNPGPEVRVEIKQLIPMPDPDKEQPGQMVLQVFNANTRSRYSGQYSFGDFEDVKYNGEYEFAFKLPSSATAVGEIRMCRRAFCEWRKLCTTNRLQWSLLRDHIRWIKNSMSRLHSGGKWNIPPVRGNSQTGPLNRPHKNN